jgi:hypothetical protein
VCAIALRAFVADAVRAHQITACPTTPTAFSSALSVSLCAHTLHALCVSLASRRLISLAEEESVRLGEKRGVGRRPIVVHWCVHVCACVVWCVGVYVYV